MVTAKWNNKVIAKSNKTIMIEGNHYFPPQDVTEEFLDTSDHQTTCPWKGRASYYNVQVEEKTNTNAAWYYPAPADAAKEIKDYVAFWKGIDVIEE